MTVSSFQRKVLGFYKRHGRDLPWRKTTDPYKVWISEIMLQQTQVDRVKEYFVRWTKRWPTVQALAKARREDVLKEWMGLGYNSRAINLHKAAQKMVEEFDGDVLKAVENYKKVPGVGPYTSAAVRIFADNKDVVTVDTNIRRILIHEFRLQESVSDAELWKLAEKCLPKGRSRDWHNALMDYGSSILTSRKTGIKPKTQQSAFEGSDRQIRARILRYVLAKQRASFADLNTVALDGARLERILGKLVGEGVLDCRKGVYKLKN